MSKNTKKLIPKLRFPEFQDSEDWNEPSLSEVCERITEKVGDKKLTTVSITAGTGFVSQAEKFSRDISGNQYKNYIVLNKGEYSFNKGNSKRFPQGCIYKLKEFDQVAAPNAFISFRFKKGNVGDFFQGYFECNRHGEQLKKFISSGARSDGLLNINADDFFTIKFPAPSQKEQQKIADCLSSIDDLITAQTQKVEALKTNKKGLMQQLFPREGETVPRLRFTEFRAAGEWQEKTLKDVCNMQAGKFVRAADISDIQNSHLYPCYGGNGLRGFTKSFTHEGKYSLIGRQGALCGNITLANGKFHATEHAVVVSPNNDVNTDWLFYMLGFMNLNQYATGQAQPGLSVENLEKLPIVISAKENEQQKIASCLSSIDDLITAQTQKLETLKSHKKGLMQQLFPSAEADSE